MKSLDAEKSSTLVIRCWMTIGGMWIYHCLFDGGIHHIHRIDIGPIRSMGIKRIRDEVELGDVIPKIFKSSKIDSMISKGALPSMDHFFWNPEGKVCSFDNSITGKVMPAGCRCDFFLGLERFFDTLEIDYKVIPSRRECMIEDGGNCFREYIFRNL
jgi:hypothetical protein